MEEDSSEDTAGSSEVPELGYVTWGPGEVFDDLGLDEAVLANDPSLPWGRPEQSSCSEQWFEVGDSSLLGYLPVASEGPGEILLFEDGAGERLVLRVDANCELVRPTP